MSRSPNCQKFWLIIRKQFPDMGFGYDSTENIDELESVRARIWPKDIERNSDDRLCRDRLPVQCSARSLKL
jgi:hypothetical protein